MTSRTTSDELVQRKDYFETEARQYFPEESRENTELSEAMAYSFHAGGKRIRPILSIAVTELMKQPVEDIIPAALAIEMIHTYSLIHDDLPSMDNDDFRRGKPTSHKVYGEALAILAGDALLTEAFHIAATYPEKQELSDGKLKFIQALAEAAGMRGMVGGQVMDMKHPAAASESYLKKLHARKTGAMIRVACIAPVILFNGDDHLLDRISRYAKKIGLLFQVTDDILDETATLEELGKTPGKDRDQNKITYPSLFGLDGAQRFAEDLLEDARTVLSDVPRAQLLLDIADFIASRTH